MRELRTCDDAVLAIGLDRHWRARMQRLLADAASCNGWAPRPGAAAFRVRLTICCSWTATSAIERDAVARCTTPPVLLSASRAASLLRCISSRANACLGKLARAEMVMRAIRAAESGLFITTPDLLLQALRDVDGAAATSEPSGDWSMLTGRQREIVRWAAQGMSNKQIARQLGISPETVKTHLHHVFDRGAVHGRMALLAAHRDDVVATLAVAGSLTPI